MNKQRGFVTLPWPPGFGLRRCTPATSAAAVAKASRPARWSGTLNRVRSFGSGILIGAGIWTPVFAAMADDPGPWGAATALALFGVAAVAGRNSRGHPGDRR
jgi:hypothetical protein